MNEDKKEICYCLEIFRKKYGEHVTGNCLKLECERYRRENKLPPQKKS